jgi:hypothetical protein
MRKQLFLPTITFWLPSAILLAIPFGAVECLERSQKSMAKSRENGGGKQKEGRRNVFGTMHPYFVCAIWGISPSLPHWWGNRQKWPICIYFPTVPHGPMSGGSSARTQNWLMPSPPSPQGTRKRV